MVGRDSATSTQIFPSFKPSAADEDLLRVARPPLTTYKDALFIGSSFCAELVNFAASLSACSGSSWPRLCAGFQKLNISVDFYFAVMALTRSTSWPLILTIF